MRLRHLRYWRCFFFGHVWLPILDKELQPVYGSGGYRCSRCPFGSGSKEALSKYMTEIGSDRTITDSAFGILVIHIDPAAPKKPDE